MTYISAFICVWAPPILPLSLLPFALSLYLYLTFIFISFVFISLYNGVTLKLTLIKCPLITTILLYKYLAANYLLSCLPFLMSVISLPFYILFNLSSYCAPLIKKSGKKMLACLIKLTLSFFLLLPSSAS